MTVILRKKHPVNAHIQKGWTFWSLLFTLSVVFIAAYIGMQLVPVYASNQNVVNALEISLDGKNLRTITRNQIIKGVRDQLYIDGTTDLLNFKDDFKVARNRERLVVEATYNREIPLVGNLVLVAKFNPRAECQLNGRCEVK